MKGLVRSPNYPDDYEGGLDCKYFFPGTAGMEVVEINFLHFELDKNFGGGCEDDGIDYLAIYDAKEKF